MIEYKAFFATQTIDGALVSSKVDDESLRVKLAETRRRNLFMPPRFALPTHGQQMLPPSTVANGESIK
jgi:hypothetical protein